MPRALVWSLVGELSLHMLTQCDQKKGGGGRHQQEKEKACSRLGEAICTTPIWQKTQIRDMQRPPGDQ